ncbi:MAG: acyl-ACP--UDP-N-acetylglucosamine O-acyltransferase [Parvularculaceae bacterium]
MSGINPSSIIEDGAQIGDGVEIGPFCRVGAHVTLSHGVKLHSHVVLQGRTFIGPDTEIFPFVSLGSPPQHLGYRGEDTSLVIGAGNKIREYVTMNPGTAQGRGETRVGDNCLFMTGAHVAHDCTVGSNVVFANNATLGGHVHVEDYVFLGGLCAVHQFCRIGAYAFVGGAAAVPGDVIPFGSVHGNHAHLAGLNIVGMKRRGLSRDVIHDLRAAYRLLFADEGTFQERIADVADLYGDRPEVKQMIAFIRAPSTRPLVFPAE